MSDDAGQIKEIDKSRQPTTGLASLAPEDEKALLKAMEAGGPKALLAFFTAVRSTTTTFGPDPETAKVMAQTEIHEEECRLKGYQASLENREKQNQRDHEYRKKKLNHQSIMTAAVLVVSVVGIGGGLRLSVSGNSVIGNPVLVASFTLLSSLAGKLLSAKDKD
jgi:hypothetical protein